MGFIGNDQNEYERVSNNLFCQLSNAIVAATSESCTARSAH